MTLTDATDGFSMTVPAGYQQLTDPSQVQALLNAGASASPLLSAQLGVAQQAFSQGAKIFALRPGLAFADNITVLALEAGGASPSDVSKLYDQVLPTLTTEGAVIHSHRLTQAAGGPALKVTYTLATAATAATAGRTVQGTQVYLIHAGKIFVTTVSQGDAGSGGTVADQLVSSMRFG